MKINTFGKKFKLIHQLLLSNIQEVKNKPQTNGS